MRTMMPSTPRRRSARSRSRRRGRRRRAPRKRKRRRSAPRRKRKSGDVEAHGIEEAAAFTESVIREMTRLNDLYGAVNLSQGFPDFPAPDIVKEAACAAIRADVNQYAVTWGAPRLREAIAEQFTRRYALPIVADEQVTVCCGSTEAMKIGRASCRERGEDRTGAGA